MISGLPDSVLCYIRELGNTKLLILLNFQLKPLHFRLPDEFELQKGTILINSLHDQDSIITSSSQIELQPGQALIIDLPS
jgi:hypothetical protein